MADYGTDELLTRLLAIERLKVLSDLYVVAQKERNGANMRLINTERQQIKKMYLKVVK